jgi:transposase
MHVDHLHGSQLLQHAARRQPRRKRVQRTMLINALRSHLAELGLIAAQGRGNVTALTALVEDPDTTLPDVARQALRPIIAQLAMIEQQIAALEASVLEWHQPSKLSRRLATIPGVGPVTASAIAVSVPDAGAFSSARQFAAWLGLVPRQNSTGGKARLGRISRLGNAYLR